ncbi:MAG: hypothetical protein MO853_11675 [Candidatus Protistobacter heckmanni]|nr:hypothetical protein [Candidatus Protistobacter heckmanni]
MAVGIEAEVAARGFGEHGGVLALDGAGDEGDGEIWVAVLQRDQLDVVGKLQIVGILFELAEGAQAGQRVDVGLDAVGEVEPKEACETIDFGAAPEGFLDDDVLIEDAGREQAEHEHHHPDQAAVQG